MALDRNRNWLDDPTQDPSLDPYAAQASAAADPWVTPTTPAPTTPPATAAQADTSSWMPPQPAATPAVSTAAPSDFTQDVGMRSGVDPAQIQDATSRGGIVDPSTANNVRYDTQLQAVRNAKDPQSKAVAQDALARQVQADLEADGHKVTWKGNLLMVDGRPYELGGEPVQSTTGGYTGPNDVDSLIQHYQATNPVGGGIDGLVQFLQQHGVNARRATHAGGQASDDKLEIDGRIRDEIYNVGGADQRWQDSPDGGGDPLAAFSGGRGGSWLDGAGGGEGFLGGFQKLYDMASAPNAFDTQMEAYVSNLLQHPESLSEHDVETMRAKSAEEAAVASQQQDEELQHFGYQAGLDTSPWLAGQRVQNDWNRRSATIDSNRNVDLAAADRRGADRRAAAGVGQSWANLKTTQKAQALTSAVSYLNTELGYDINLKRLSEQSDEFKATLMQRIAELQQADNQFRANYGLESQRLDHNIDQDMWERGRVTAGA